MKSAWHCAIGTAASADQMPRNPRSLRALAVASLQLPVERDMASMRVGRKWLKKAKRTRLPRLDSIPRKDLSASGRPDRSSNPEIIVDLTEQRENVRPD